LLKNIQTAPQVLAANDRSNAIGEVKRNLVYTSVTPCRFFDTRNTGLGKISGNTSRDFGVIAPGFAGQGGVAGNCGIDAGAVALAINLVVAEQNGPGYATVYAAGTSLPPASSINYPAGTTQYAEANFGIYPICTANCPNGKGLSVYSSETASVLADVVGYFMPPNRGGDGLRVSSIVPTVDNLSASVNVVNGSNVNSVNVGVLGAKISGGGIDSLNSTDGPNVVSGNFGTIGGGVPKRFLVVRVQWEAEPATSLLAELQPSLAERTISLMGSVQRFPVALAMKPAVITVLLADAGKLRSFLPLDNVTTEPFFGQTAREAMRFVLKSFEALQLINLR
jgi:hypothetical protein